MKIELIGLPGSGKTYLSKKKSFELNINILFIGKKICKYFFCVIFCFYRFYFFVLILKLIYVENKNNKKLLSHKLYLFSECISLEGKAFFSDNYLIDQGFMYLPFSIFDRQIKEEDLAIFLNYYNKSCKNRILLLLEVEENIRQNRIRKRGRRPRSAFGSDYALEFDSIISFNKDVVYRIYLKNIKNAKIFFN